MSPGAAPIEVIVGATSTAWSVAQLPASARERSDYLAPASECGVQMVQLDCEWGSGPCQPHRLECGPNVAQIF